MLNVLILTAVLGAPSDADRAPVAAVIAAPVRVVVRVAEVRPARRVVGAVVRAKPARRSVGAVLRAKPLRRTVWAVDRARPVRRLLFPRAR